MSRYPGLLLGLAWIWLLGSGCATTLRKEVRQIPVSQEKPHTLCRAIGVVYGSGDDFSLSKAHQKASDALRKQAHQRGGNYVALTQSKVTPLVVPIRLVHNLHVAVLHKYGHQVQLRGRIYQCL